MNAMIIRESVADHIVSTMTALNSKNPGGPGVKTLMAVFSPSMIRSMDCKEAVVKRLDKLDHLLQLQNSVNRVQYWDGCINTSTTIRFIVSGHTSTRGFDAHHMVVVGLPLSNALFSTAILPLIMMDNCPGVVVTQ